MIGVIRESVFEQLRLDAFASGYFTAFAQTS
jgi:hypothetical protein